MSISISQTPPSPQDPPRLLAEKLSDPDTWSTGTGEPDTGLLDQIRTWPNTWPELNEWIGAVIADPRNGREPIPAPPKRSLRDRLQGRRGLSRPKASSKAGTPVSEPPLPPTDRGDSESLGHGVDDAPVVRRTVSWQNVRIPAFAFLAVLLVAACCIIPLATRPSSRPAETARPAASSQTSRRKPDPKAERAREELRDGIMEARKRLDVSVSAPETIGSLRSAISDAERALKSRRTALTELRAAERRLGSAVRAVDASHRQKEEDDRKAAEQERQRQEQERQRQEQEAARKAAEAEEARKAAEEQRRQQQQQAQQQRRQSRRTAPRYTPPAQRRRSRPAAPSSPSPPSGWNVPGDACTEGCL